MRRVILIGFFILLFNILISFENYSNGEGYTAIRTEFFSSRGTILLHPNKNWESWGYFLLDSGVTVPVIDRDFAKELGAIDDVNLRLEHFFTIPHLINSKLLVEDLLPLSKKLGVPILGVIPLYFPGYEIFLDFGKSRIQWRLVSLETQELMKKEPYIKINFSPEKQVPEVLVILNNRYSIMAKIDIAKSEYIGLPMRLLSDERVKVRSMRFAHFENKKGVCFFKLDSIKVGNVKMENIIGVASVDDKDAWLGTRFLRHFGVCISYELGRMYLLGDSREVRGEDWNGTGILLDSFEEEGWKVGVLEHSSASENGILPGDLLMSVEGKEVKNILVDELLRLLNGCNGSKVKCVFKSSLTGEVKEVSLLCRNIFKD